MKDESSRAVTRRTALRGAAGVAAVWSAPVVVTVTAPTPASASPICVDADAKRAECDELEGIFNELDCDCETDPERLCDRRHPDWDEALDDCCNERHPRWNAARGDCREGPVLGAPIALGLAAGTGMVATGATLAALAARRSAVEQVDTADPAASAEPPAEPPA